MSTETINPTEERKRLDKDITDMISALTTRLTSLQRAQKAGGGHEDGHGVSIITMAGNNSGATMTRSDAADREGVSHQLAPPPEGEHEAVVPPEWATFVNSNLQAINNSIMLETKYKSNDPGVHMDISEALEPNSHKHGGQKGKAKAASVSSYDSAPHSP